jgi:chromosome partitioning protein
MWTTAVVNQKGGVGKTATTLNVGGALAEAGRRVLVVDLDPQGHLTDALRVGTAGEPATLAAALIAEWEGKPAELVTTHSDRLDVVPNSMGMFTVGRQLDRLRAREERLGRILDGLAADYDHCLIDCPPALDILTDNALTAADGVLIPVQAEDSSLHALRLLLAQIDALESELRRERPLKLHGLVVSMLDRGAGGVARSNVGRTVVAEFERLPLPILAIVPRGVAVTEAWRVGQPVVSYASDGEHAQVYRTLATALDGDTA